MQTAARKPKRKMRSLRSVAPASAPALPTKEVKPRSVACASMKDRAWTSPQWEEHLDGLIAAAAARSFFFFGGWSHTDELSSINESITEGAALGALAADNSMYAHI